MRATYILSMLVVLTVKTNASFKSHTRYLTREKNANKPDVFCMYNRNEWKSCDSATKTMERQFDLISGTTPPCEPNFTIATTCHSLDCHYRRNGSKWGPCENGVRERTDILVGKKGNTDCKDTRKVTKKCGTTN